VVGPSFQLSFAAITSIVALHEWGVMQRLTGPQDEGMFAKAGRGLLALLLTGVVVEVALAPIALYHFHKQGLYGALANIVAIPLTTFVTMPLEALALLFDAVGLGAPFWWATGASLDLLLWIARTVAAWPGAVAALPTVPLTAFALMIYGALWLMLWHGRVRVLGFAPFLIGALWALLTPPPDLLVTGDGMHLAVRGDDGRLATLRPRAGDYVRSVMSERFGDLDDLQDLDAVSGAACTDDVCRFDLARRDRTWRIMATRSRYLLPPQDLRRECAAADIVVSDRRLPPWCVPKWIKADRAFLAQTGGLAITFANANVETVAEGDGEHPWVVARRTVDKANSARRRERQQPEIGNGAKPEG
jgi:competence protein ComEC